MPKTSNVTPLRNGSKTKTEAKPKQPLSDDAVAVRFPKFCEMIGVSPTKGKQLIREGRVRSVKLGQTRLISMSSIRALIEGEAA